MNKEEKNVLIPRLRFPEFENNKDWKSLKLSSVLVEHGSKSSGTEEVHSVSVHKGVINQIEHLGRSFAAATTDHYKRVFPGDMIYTKSPTGDFPYGIIKQSRISTPVIVSPLYGVFTPETQGLGCILDAYFESSENTHNYLASIVQKGAKNTIAITNDRFLSKSLVFPTNKKEQQKIASCLSSLDELIEAETERLGALQAHKKGMLQQLFPAEGETVPQLRFSEFEDSGDWEEKELGSSLLQHPEYGINAAAVPYSKDLPTYLRITDISESGNYLSEKKVSVEKDVTESNFLNEGDIVLARTGASVGKSYKYNLEDGKLVFAGFLIRVKPDKDKLLTNFLVQFLSTDQYWSWVKFSSTRSGQPGINGKQYASMPLSFPPTILEQQKIANCLSSLDQQLTTLSDQLEGLKLHKKGLMQGLLPQIED